MPEGAHILPNLPRVSASRRDEALPYEPVCAIFRRYLHGRKLKFTPERAMILDAVLRRTGLFEAERLVADLKQIGHAVSRATAYRTLAHLQDAGILKQVFFDNKQSYYEVIAGRQTYDYLICVATGKVVEFSSEKLRRLRDEICNEHGFSPLSHQFHIFAVSPEGQAKPGADASPTALPAGPAATTGVVAEVRLPTDVVHRLAEGDERREGEDSQADLAAPERRRGEVDHGGNHS
jgi:Fur family ferric uptake transcriptional regulator